MAMKKGIFSRISSWLGLNEDSGGSSFWDMRGSDADVPDDGTPSRPTLNGKEVPAGKVNQKIRQCPFCNHEFSNDDVEFEETASYTPSLMWQVCPTHGRVSEFQWTPVWRYDYPRLPDDTPYRRA